MAGEDTETLRKEIDELRQDFVKIQEQHITLQKVVYDKESSAEHKKEDNWNLAENNALISDIPLEKDLYFKKDIKTFIQKVKEDVYKVIPTYNREEHPDYPFIGKPKVNEIIDKRIGKL